MSVCPTSDSTDEMNRLRWRCRRGLLELDLVLTGFLDQHYRALSADMKRGFRGLLEYADQDILALVNGDISTDLFAGEKDLNDLIQLLRTYRLV